MKLSQFQYNLPDKLIALKPTHDRDESRLMIVNRATGEIKHKIFREILDYFKENDLLVFNDTKVFPARLHGTKEKTGANIEVFLLRELNRDQRLWDVLVDPARKIRIGNKLYFGKDSELVAEVIDNTTSRGRTLRFLFDGTHEQFKKILYKLGETPLPKFIKREVEPEDSERYQTIFAAHEGAVAAPTAGMHFSRELLKRFEILGTKRAFITLHAGLGNFRDVEVEDLTKHKMDSERIIVSEETVKLVCEAHQNKNSICAVGTTVLKTLETVTTTPGNIKVFDGWTNKFIFPPYEVTIVDKLISNFHLPKSTLLMMTAAFGGYDNIMNAYDIAIKEKYRFGSYGDAMLII